MNKTIKRILFFLLSVYLVLCFGLYFFQEFFIFQSTSLPEEYVFEYPIPFEEFTIENDGVSINALHFKAENSKGIMVYYHGNMGDLSRWGEEVQPLLKYSYDIVVMDYRGYGKSDGEPSEELMYQDAELFYQYATERVDEANIIVYGRSLGSAFATYVGSKNHPKQLILETPFYSLKSVVRETLPFLPINYMLNYSFENHQYASEVDCPTLVLLAMQDDVVAYKNGLRLTDELQFNTNVSFEGATHNDLMNFPLYWESLDQFLNY